MKQSRNRLMPLPQLLFWTGKVEVAFCSMSASTFIWVKYVNLFLILPSFPGIEGNEVMVFGLSNENISSAVFTRLRKASFIFSIASAPLRNAVTCFADFIAHFLPGSCVLEPFGVSFRYGVCYSWAESAATLDRGTESLEEAEIGRPPSSSVCEIFGVVLHIVYNKNIIS